VLKTSKKKKKVATALKVSPQQEFQNVSNSGNIVGLSAQLLEGGTWKVTPSQ
jgi:hypothetical protein